MSTFLEVSLTERVCENLRLEFGPDGSVAQKRSQKRVDQFAHWCGCTPKLLIRFVDGKTKSIGNDVLDALAMLTGVYPAADAAQTRWRRKLASKWITSPDLRDRHPSLTRYIRHRERLQAGIKLAKEWQDSKTSRDPEATSSSGTSFHAEF